MYSEIGSENERKLGGSSKCSRERGPSGRGGNWTTEGRGAHVQICFQSAALLKSPACHGRTVLQTSQDALRCYAEPGKRAADLQ